MSLVVGQLVSSKAGRDAGNYYLVIRVLDRNFVLLADGSRRKVSNPKKKNARHLVAHQQVAQSVAEAFASNGKITNEQIRNELRKLVKLSDQGREEGSTVNG